MTEQDPETEDYSGVVRTSSLVLAVLISIGVSIYAASTTTFDIHLPIFAWLCTVIAYFALPKSKD